MRDHLRERSDGMRGPSAGSRAVLRARVWCDAVVGREGLQGRHHLCDGCEGSLLDVQEGLRAAGPAGHSPVPHRLRWLHRAVPESLADVLEGMPACPEETAGQAEPETPGAA